MSTPRHRDSVTRAYELLRLFTDKIAVAPCSVTPHSIAKSDTKRLLDMLRARAASTVGTLYLPRWPLRLRAKHRDGQLERLHDGSMVPYMASQHMAVRLRSPSHCVHNLGYAVSMSSSLASIAEWLRSPLGQRVYSLERKHVGDALARVFGWQLVQLGMWGDDHGLIAHARTQTRSVLVPDDAPIPHGLRDRTTLLAQSRFDALSIASDSVDAVLLPHTLEHVSDPHVVLREVERILMGEGHVIVLGFRPFSLWGTRHMLSREGFPPATERMLGEGRVRDWLKLLGFEIVDAKRYLFTLPFGRAVPGMQRLVETLGERAWPLFAGAYMLKARKRVYTLTPIRMRWRSRTGVVGGLVEPAAGRIGRGGIGQIQAKRIQPRPTPEGQ